MRKYELNRNTLETNISLSLSLDGGEISINSGCGFLDHMLTLFA
jgi:imidazoleglycerol-phosphate dehydratase